LKTALQRTPMFKKKRTNREQTGGKKTGKKKNGRRNGVGVKESTIKGSSRPGQEGKNETKTQGLRSASDSNHLSVGESPG